MLHLHAPNDFAIRRGVHGNALGCSYVLLRYLWSLLLRGLYHPTRVILLCLFIINSLTR